MFSLKPCEPNLHLSLQPRTPKLAAAMLSSFQQGACARNGNKKRSRKLVVRGFPEEEESVRRSFLGLEEAGLVEISGLSSHERFLCRLTISSLNLLRVISEQEGLPIEELNAGRICDWFLKDKLKREQNLESAVLQWDESELPI